MIDFGQATKNSGKTILFCEPDPRIIQAAKKIQEHGLKAILIGEEQDYQEAAKNPQDLQGIDIHPINPDDYAEEYYELRKHKQISREDAKKTLQDPAYYSCMHLRAGKADGIVAGATWPTSNTLRPALQTLNQGLASSYFIMQTPRGEYLFSDCALNVHPNSEELTQIAINTAQAAEQMGVEPRIAMLSFSTVGSAAHPDQKKVMQATQALRRYCEEHDKNWVVSGEYQADAALNKTVAAKKAPEGEIQGDANILIFPTLDAGNIGYKLVAQFSDTKADGPIITNLQKPVNDLSRGANAQEIYEVALITAWQSQQE